MSQDNANPRIFGNDEPRTLFLLRHRFQKPPHEFEEAYAGHRAYFKRNLQSGRFIVVGPVVPWDGGMILALAADRAEAERMVDEDPLVAAGITQYEITEWKTTVRHPGFSELLDELAATTQESDTQQCADWTR